MRVKITSSGIPIANGDDVCVPKVGDVIEVSNSVGTALIRGNDGEQVEVAKKEEPEEKKPKEKKAKGKAPKNKNLGAAPENK